jgi:hypothetical protein
LRFEACKTAGHTQADERQKPKPEMGEEARAGEMSEEDIERAKPKDDHHESDTPSTPPDERQRRQNEASDRCHQSERKGGAT